MDFIAWYNLEIVKFNLERSKFGINFLPKRVLILRLIEGVLVSFRIIYYWQYADMSFFELMR